MEKKNKTFIWPTNLKKGERICNEKGFFEHIYSVENLEDFIGATIVNTIMLKEGPYNTFRAYIIKNNQREMLWEEKRELPNKLEKANLRDFEKRENNLYKWRVN